MPILDKHDLDMKDKFDEFMRTSPYANSTQDIAWSHVKSDWANEQVFLEEDGRIIAGMSIIFKKVMLGHSLAYAPRGPICDINDVNLVKRLIDEARCVLKKHKAFVFKFDPEVKFDENLSNEYKKAGFIVRNIGCGKDQLIQPRLNMMLDIKDKSFDELMPLFSEKTRYNIRLSERKGVTVRYSRNVKDLETFYDIYKITTLRDEIGARPLSYFQRMLAAFEGDMLRIYIAEHENQPLSAAIAINYGKKMWYIYGASSNEKRNLMPNYAMQTAMINWAIEEGCETYDFGGVFELNKENGLFKFKEGFCRKDGVTELIGEFDMIVNPFIYNLFEKILPKIKAKRKQILEKRRTRNNKD